MYPILKRIFDFLSALLLLLLLLPLFLGLLLLVRLLLGAPVFFRQRRTGRYGRPFSILKFRTMTDRRGEDGRLLPDEDRVTPFGQFLRSTSLDEIPELLNILAGDMSVIGPRSLPLSYDAYYRNGERARFAVRGGLIPPDTLIQEPYVSWDVQLACEADYAAHLSFSRDFRIFLSVFKLLVKRDRSDYGGYVRKPLSEERAGEQSLPRKKLCVITTIETTMEIFVVPAMEVFVQRGYDVTLVCNMSEKFIRQHSARFHCVNLPMRRGISLRDLLTMPWRFWKLFRKERFDYVQYATTNASFYAALPALLDGIPTRVYCQWGILYVGSQGLQRLLYKWVEKFLCITATHITSASHKNRDFAVAEGLTPAGKISVIGDGGTVGVDFAVFDIRRRDEYRERVLSEYPDLSGKTVFGYVGRIEKDKGVAELLTAFLELYNRGRQNVALLLIGGFDELRSGFDPELIRQARECPAVVFHGYAEDVPVYMSAIDVLVHPTYREGFSMVIQQAMAMGCAVITTDIPGPSEVIEKDVSGLLVPPRDFTALGRAMNWLAQDGQLRERLARAGYRRVCERFGRERMLELTYQDRIRMMNDKQ